MSKKDKTRVNVVYSTNPNFNFEEEEFNEIETPENQQQQLKVFVDRKQRKGKSVTIVSGFEGSEEDMQNLAKTLKTKCGVGGNAKDGEILIQGELKDKVYDLLINLGYTKTKKIGG
ncbi:MAG: translation initiation factor [Flavobacteriales bacterium]|nr:translation initiation factor [Flavobacteriales bacterium]MCB9173577.1 translation initiation factor [Flavobacteriales bacterium]MCB9364272.1 translation initiation factor [Flavobacteriales bacterium]